jgi:sugar phosphate isomerase/epimerase
MVVETVVLCPDLVLPTTYDRAALAAELLDRGVGVCSPGIPPTDPTDDARTQAAHWVAHLSVALSGGLRAPVLLVLAGASGALAPALGFSQRAARRAVAGYLLLDADCPAAGAVIGDWPDAPVHYLASPAASEMAVGHVRLRGWQRHDVPNLAPATLATTLQSLLT